MARRHESVDWISDCLTCANGPKIKKCPRPGSAPSDERGAMRQTEGTPTRTHPILPIARRMDGMMERERTSERAASPSASSLRSLQGSKGLVHPHPTATLSVVGRGRPPRSQRRVFFL